MIDIEQLAAEKAFLITEIITYKKNEALDRNKKLKVFNIIRSRYVRLLRTGKSIPSDEKSLLKEVEDFQIMSNITIKYIPQPDGVE